MLTRKRKQRERKKKDACLNTPLTALLVSEVKMAAKIP